ncbi:arginine/serine-rich protein 1 isoform X3 [Thunnus maccoyii]|uniref:arginine/serine-rich protein 1 isoform X3 n=1 Tax=Thunnus maccoyii TaxID=8240 RepID=UPI001C4CAC47|nr:arginine/serine-rich protein 1 isoform X3 [Thunnus maccoyii]
MAKGEDARSEMALARQSDGINVIFDQNSPPSSWSRTRTSSDSSCPSSSGSYRGRGSNRGRYRSSSSTSSSSSSRSSSRARSRSHPRCHRRSSRCRCDNHRRYGRGRYRRSPPRHYKAHSRSPSPDRYSRRRRYRSRSRSSSGLRRYRGAGSRLRCQISQSSPRSCRSRSRSRSSGRSVSSSLGDKRELLKDAAANAVKILGLETLELPESVKPSLSEQCGESPVSETWVRQDPEKTPSQNPPLADGAQACGLHYSDYSCRELKTDEELLSICQRAVMWSLMSSAQRCPLKGKPSLSALIILWPNQQWQLRLVLR